MSTKTKKVIKTVGNVILWVFLALAIVMTILAFSATASGTGIPKFGDTCFLMVESDSMKGPEWREKGFKKGDMIIGKVLTDEEKLQLQVGDVITFFMEVPVEGGSTERVLNTHRIVSTDLTNTVTPHVNTKGDANEIADGYNTSLGDIQAKWTGKRIGGVGGFISFLQSKVGFMCCIVLPLAIFFVYEVFEMINLIRAIKNKDKKVITAEDEEMIKQKAIEEFLAKQAAEKAAAENGNNDNNP